MSQGVSIKRPTRPPFWKFQWRRERSPDAAAVVRASGLPAELATFVLSVVKRCRLWREERVDVARELCGHFQEGLLRGESAADLIGAFGDARQGAKLITRAKRRCRPWWWKGMRDARRVVYGGVLVAASWYGYHAARFYWGTPRVTFNVVTKMNESSLAVPAAQRAWPVYRDAYLAIPAEAADGGSTDGWPSRPNGGGLAVGYMQSLSKDERATVVAFAKRWAPQIESFRRAAAIERSAFVVSGDSAQTGPREEWFRGERQGGANPPAYAMLLPQLGAYRQIGRALAMDAVRAVDAGDGEAVVKDVRAMMGIARHSAEDGTMIGQLVGNGVLMDACAEVREATVNMPTPLSERQLIELMHALSAHRVNAQQATRLDLSLERAAFEDLLQRTYTDDGHGNGHLTRAAMDMDGGRNGLDRWIGPALSGVVADRRTMSEAHARVMESVNEQLDLPLYRRDAHAIEARARESRGGVLGGGGTAIIESLMGPYLLAQRQVDEGLALRDATVAGLGCELFKLRNGRYPTGWSELVPSILPAAPVDPWTGKALGYRADAGALDAGRPLIYSGGFDKTDDGGEFALNAHTEQWHGKDWALWPMLPPPPPPTGTGGMSAGFGWTWMGMFWGK